MEPSRARPAGGREPVPARQALGKEPETGQFPDSEAPPARRLPKVPHGASRYAVAKRGIGGPGGFPTPEAHQQAAAESQGALTPVPPGQEIQALAEQPPRHARQAGPGPFQGSQNSGSRLLWGHGRHT